MWNYKNCYYLSLGMIVFLIACFMVTLSGFQYSKTISDIIWFLDILYECVLLYSLIVLLKTFGESKWRVFSFCLFVSIKIISSISGSVLQRKMTRTAFQNEALFMGVLATIALIYLIINIFRIKDNSIKFYFRAYAYTLITLFLYSVFGVLVLGLMGGGIEFFKVNGYIRDVLAMLPYLAITMMYWKLYDQNFRFRVGDAVLIKRQYDNVPLGSQGVIVDRHNTSGYYEAEFFDDRGNLLNVLTVPSKDIEHKAEPDLEARIEASGK